MRAIKAILGFVLGLGLGLALGYGLATWLLDRQDASGSSQGREKIPPLRLVEQLQDRFRVAVEEGRRAAEEARAELEAQAYGFRSEPEDGESVI